MPLSPSGWSALASGAIAIQAEAPAKITELLFQSFAPLGDSADKITADLTALPGSAAVWFGPLEGAPRFAFGDPRQQLALGSTFKLYVLSALERTVAKVDWNGTMWSRSATRAFPADSPKTGPPMPR